jgi:predicted ABC-type ATPase
MAQVLLPQKLGIRELVNADEIARGLSPFNAGGVSVAAGRLMIARIRKLVRDRNSDEGRTLIAERTPEASLVVHDAGRWAMIERATP